MAATSVICFVCCFLVLFFGYHGASARPQAYTRCGGGYYHEMPPYKFPNLDENGDVIPETRRPATRSTPKTTTPSDAPSELPTTTESSRSRSVRSVHDDDATSLEQDEKEVMKNLVNQSVLKQVISESFGPEKLNKSRKLHSPKSAPKVDARTLQPHLRISDDRED